MYANGKGPPVYRMAQATLSNPIIISIYPPSIIANIFKPKIKLKNKENIVAFNTCCGLIFPELTILSGPSLRFLSAPFM